LKRCGQISVVRHVLTHNNCVNRSAKQRRCLVPIALRAGDRLRRALAISRKETMLELRPTCENCNKSLPPSSLEARICTYECTFCASCVDNVLGNVCPNCGGGFVPRPIRPSRNWNGDNYLGKDPASTKIKHRPVDRATHAKFSAEIKNVPPDKR
jgi:hypothetical protein